MDNNLNDQTTENSEGEEKSPSSYTDPNAGYTEAEPQAKNDNSVPKEAADDNLKQEEKSHPAYTYGEMPKSENGTNFTSVYGMKKRSIPIRSWSISGISVKKLRAARKNQNI